jgi:hypothetical protein
MSTQIPTVSIEAAHSWLERLLPGVDLNNVKSISLTPETIFHKDGPQVSVELYRLNEAGEKYLENVDEVAAPVAEGEPAPEPKVAMETKLFPLIALPTTY